MTVLFIALSIFPIVAVKSSASYAAKVSGIVIAINAAGALYYWRAQKRRSAEAQRQTPNKRLAFSVAAFALHTPQ
jgi:membrane associated rhomboid family serine protease